MATLELSRIELEILLSIERGSRHGYAILKSIARRGTFPRQLHAGSVYRTLARLLDGGLVQEEPEEGQSRRRRYRLTDAGHRCLDSELGRLRRLLEAATRPHASHDHRRVPGLDP
jgi:DNA-binding PadR family transcriptional regulator